MRVSTAAKKRIRPVSADLLRAKAAADPYAHITDAELMAAYMREMGIDHARRIVDGTIDKPCDPPANRRPLSEFAAAVPIFIRQVRDEMTASEKDWAYECYLDGFNHQLDELGVSAAEKAEARRKRSEWMSKVTGRKAENVDPR